MPYSFVEYLSSGVFVVSPEASGDAGIQLDDNFRALVDKDVALLAALTAHTSATNVHGATVTATPSRLLIRDANGSAELYSVDGLAELNYNGPALIKSDSGPLTFETNGNPGNIQAGAYYVWDPGSSSYVLFTGGASGYSGYSGATGTSGFSGYSGRSGTSGFSGYSGSGASGYSGYSGSGASGYSGYSGAGTSGFSGYSGSGGASGYSGYSGSGASGYSGYSGAGTSGFSGYSGAGTSGFSGYSGMSGFSGYSGKSGFSGYSGSGISGFSGYSGAGTSGFSGYSGAGTSGFSGYSGSGVSGFSGYSGSGVSGYSGYSGSGISGYSGYSGAGLSGFSGYSGNATSGFSGYSGRSGYSGYSGLSGYSGYSGYSGSGISGYSGYSGLGLSGYSGYSGNATSGFSGYSGRSGYSGFSGIPGGSNTQVQFNDSNAFGGDAGFVYDKTTDTGTIGTMKATNVVAGGRTSIAQSGGTLSPDATFIVNDVTQLSADITTMSNPSGTPYDGQKLVLRFQQNASAAKTITWSGSQWVFGTDCTAAQINGYSTLSSYFIVLCEWHNTSSKWRVLAASGGYL